MYDLPDTGPEFDRGTSLLLAGPDAAVRPYAARCVEDAAAAGEGVVVVLADDDAPLPDLGDAAGPVGLVDCRARRGPVPDAVPVRTPAPDDLGSVGVAASELLERFREARGCDRNRVLVASTGSLLAAAGDEPTFRFLHVLAGRVRSAGALGLVVHGGDATGARAGTLRPVFDGVVTVEPGGDPEYAAVGSR